MTPIIFNIVPPILTYQFIANISQHYRSDVAIALAEQRGGYRHVGLRRYGYAWEAESSGHIRMCFYVDFDHW